jgi:ferredoxin
MLATGQRLRRNAWGRYYVTDECNGCGLCVECAGANFERSDDGTYYYVIQQPYDETEEQAIADARNACGKACIRDDGEE